MVNAPVVCACVDMLPACAAHSCWDRGSHNLDHALYGLLGQCHLHHVDGRQAPVDLPFGLQHLHILFRATPAKHWQLQWHVNGTDLPSAHPSRTKHGLVVSH